MKKLCRACQHYSENVEEPRTQGECRERPPRVEVENAYCVRTYWPVVNDSDWCGSWAAREAGDDRQV